MVSEFTIFFCSILVSLFGEAPAFFCDSPLKVAPKVVDSNSGSRCEVSIDDGLRDVTYVIGSEENDSDSTISVRVFKKSANEWVVPAVLGTKPVKSNGHSAVPLDETRILVIKSNSTSDDCFWFLEIDTPFVRDQKTRFRSEVAVVAWSKGVVGEAVKPVVISGPSGVGKGTLISKLMEEFPSTFGFSVSHTTRAPRNNEQDGVHYHFVERDAMEKDIRDGKFLEFASVHGNLYGTSVEAVEAVTDQGKKCILDIDVQGARSVRRSSLEAVFIFVRPPSFHELEKRLRSRGTETEEQIQKRLRNAEAELQQGNSPGLFDHILVNDDLEKCYQRLKEILSLSSSGSVVKNTENNNVSSASKGVDIPSKHSVSRHNQKVLIKCSEGGDSDSMLELSSIRGGAPCRTRGLKLNKQSFDDRKPVRKWLPSFVGWASVILEALLLKADIVGVKLNARERISD
ncbi:hypothetical protein M569_04991 [Genlisea aurea]|uniref:Guanylate kinase 1 n=1 Tax=Genlisea aurea TaxID=192259 RepID=S8E258_9LAMI|nr:hypothetical protein M569_04991 [Genlisea aurea]